MLRLCRELLDCQRREQPMRQCSYLFAAPTIRVGSWHQAWRPLSRVTGRMRHIRFHAGRAIGTPQAAAIMSLPVPIVLTDRRCFASLPSRCSYDTPQARTVGNNPTAVISALSYTRAPAIEAQPSQLRHHRLTVRLPTERVARQRRPRTPRLTTPPESQSYPCCSDEATRGPERRPRNPTLCLSRSARS